MIQKLNLGILFTLIGLFCFSLFRFYVQNDIYPYALLIFVTLICIAMYFSLTQLNSIPWKNYVFASILSLFNSFILFADYFYPVLLKSTWNFSFMIALILIFYALLVRIQQIQGKLSSLTFWTTIITGVAIEIVLAFKISLPIVHSVLTFGFLLSSIMIISLFASQFKRGNQ